MSEFPASNLSSAMTDFQAARRKATMQTLLSRMSGKSEDLLSFEEISKKVKLTGQRKTYRDNIPLDAIIGSVGRYRDFNRNFLPLSDADAARWARVKVAQEMSGLPPIEVYKIGEAYFVLDGNHRVSIARQLEMDFIEAYVTEYSSQVELSPDDDYYNVIMKAEYAELMDQTGLDRLRPDIDFTVTVPGRYHEIYEHIVVHRFYLGQENGREIALDEAVTSWVDNIYLPVIRLIRQRGVLRDFPNRTETDLYLWLKKYQAELTERLGWQVEIEQTAADLSQRFSPRLERTLSSMWNNLADFLTPDPLESGPPPGEWRVNVGLPRKDKLFAAILVSLSGRDENWLALEQALPVAQHEDSVLRGLHVVQHERELDSPQVVQVRDRFYQQCQEAGVRGEFAVETGVIARKVVQRATWTDLVVLHLFHPPGTRPLSRLRSGYRTILMRCPRPILAVPQTTDKLQTALLAYDGSPKAEEALFLSSYIACSWDCRILVMGSFASSSEQERTLGRAQEYLEKNGVAAEYLRGVGKPSDVLLQVARERDVDLMVMGGYSSSPLLTVVVSGTLDHVLRDFRKPVLVCR